MRIVLWACVGLLVSVSLMGAESGVIRGVDANDTLRILRTTVDGKLWFYTETDTVALDTLFLRNDTLFLISNSSVDTLLTIVSTADDDVTLADVQSACTNDFHNIGGVDDDLPDADEIVESMLKCVNAPTDEYSLTYEATTGDFEWQTGGSDDDITAVIWRNYYLIVEEGATKDSAKIDVRDSALVAVKPAIHDTANVIRPVIRDTAKVVKVDNATLADSATGAVRSHSLVLNSALGSDSTWSGTIASVTVDVNAKGMGQLLFLSADGHYDPADADATTTMPGCVITLEGGTGTKKVMLKGYVRDDTWNWTMGAGIANLLYASTVVGSLVQVKPSGSGDQVQIIGYCVTADCIYFEPNLMLIEAP